MIKKCPVAIEPINDLIKLFIDEKWSINYDSLKKNDFPYDLPDIVLSKRIKQYSDLLKQIRDEMIINEKSEKKINEELKELVNEELKELDILDYLNPSGTQNQKFRNAIELMGAYKVEKTGEQEGSIYLYYEKIRLVAMEYNAFKSKDPANPNPIKFIDLIVESLTSLVLYHEFIHWIMHWMSPPYVGEAVPIKYDSADSINYHEGFAQLFTFWYAQDDELRKDIFNWLSPQQPPQYSKYEELLEKEITRYEAICLIEICRGGSSQSWNNVLWRLWLQRKKIGIENYF